MITTLIRYLGVVVLLVVCLLTLELGIMSFEYIAIVILVIICMGE